MKILLSGEMYRSTDNEMKEEESRDLNTRMDGTGLKKKINLSKLQFHKTCISNIYIYHTCT